MHNQSQKQGKKEKKIQCGYCFGCKIKILVFGNIRSGLLETTRPEDK